MKEKTIGERMRRDRPKHKQAGVISSYQNKSIKRRTVKDSNGNTFVRPKGITIYNTEPKLKRNDPCKCGSGKKFKKCCLNNEGDNV